MDWGKEWNRKDFFSGIDDVKSVNYLSFTQPYPSTPWESVSSGFGCPDT